MGTVHDLPRSEATSVRIEPEDGRSTVGADACMAGQEQALESRRPGAAPAATIPESSEDSRDERPGIGPADGEAATQEFSIGAGRGKAKGFPLSLAGGAMAVLNAAKTGDSSARVREAAPDALAKIEGK